MGNLLCSRSGDKDGDVESPAVTDLPRDPSETEAKVVPETATEEGGEEKEDKREIVAEKKSPSDDSSKKTESRLRGVACGIFYCNSIFVILQSVYMLLCAIAYFVAEYCYPKKSLFNGGKDGAKVVADAIYFVVVSFTTVGFGDITPNGDGVKIVTSIVVLVGVILMPMANIVVNQWFDALDDWILNKFTSRFCSAKSMSQGEEPRNSAEGGWTLAKFADYLDTANMARKISIRLAMAGVYALLCTGLGQLCLLIEHMSYGKSMYTALMSQTSVGYGDLAFKSTGGRSVGSIWILLAAAVTSRFLDLLVQSRTHKCMKKMLQKDPTESELRAAGITPETSRDEYVLLRLKGVNLIDNDLIDNIDAQRKRMESRRKT